VEGWVFRQQCQLYKKKDETDWKKQETDRLQKVGEKLELQQQLIDALTSQRGTIGPFDPAFDIAAGPPSQRKSGVASMELVRPTDDITAPRYPVDDITEMEMFELHAKCMNRSVKVVAGYVLPPGPNATHHCSPVQDGYAIVGVDEVIKGFEQLDLDFPIGELETSLVDALRVAILWKKEHIMLPHWTPHLQTLPEEAPQQTPHSSNPAQRQQTQPPQQTPPPQLSPPCQQTLPEEAPQQTPPRQ